MWTCEIGRDHECEENSDKDERIKVILKLKVSNALAVSNVLMCDSTKGIHSVFPFKGFDLFGIWLYGFLVSVIMILDVIGMKKKHMYEWTWQALS